jgi:hypothetical protein
MHGCMNVTEETSACHRCRHLKRVAYFWSLWEVRPAATRYAVWSHSDTRVHGHHS